MSAVFGPVFDRPREFKVFSSSNQMPFSSDIIPRYLVSARTAQNRRVRRAVSAESFK